MNKVLIITYYWPPAGGPAVQRMLKFIKYLPEMGWEPIILTVKNGSYYYFDDSLIEQVPDTMQVNKTKSLDPIRIYKKFTGLKKGERVGVAAVGSKQQGVRKRIANFVRLNIFIPDAKIGWIPFAVRRGKQIIKEYKPDLILSSSPPQSVHLIAKQLSQQTGIKWIADFRDPWTNIYHYDQVQRLKIVSKFDRKLEQSVLRTCDHVVHSSPNMKSSLLLDEHKRSTTIMNGYDQDEFSLQTDRPAPFNSFTISYAGSMSSFAHPKNLFAAIDQLMEDFPTFQDDFKFLFMGKVAPEIWADLQQKDWFDQVSNLGYVNHELCVSNLMRSQVLLLVIPQTSLNQSIVPSKLFEYIGANQFVLSIGPRTSDVHDIIRDCECGSMFEYDDYPGVFQLLRKMYIDWTKGNGAFHAKNRDKYTRKHSARLLADVMNEAIKSE